MPGKPRRGGRSRAKPARTAPVRHNPLARQLADARFGKRVVETKTGYKRRPKHPKAGDEGE